LLVTVSHQIILKYINICLKGLVIIFGKVYHQIKAGLSQSFHNIVTFCKYLWRPSLSLYVWSVHLKLSVSSNYNFLKHLNSQIKQTFYIFQNGWNSKLVFEIISRYSDPDQLDWGSEIFSFSVLWKFAWSLQHLTSDGTSSGKNFWILLTEWIFVIFWGGRVTYQHFIKVSDEPIGPERWI